MKLDEAKQKIEALINEQNSQKMRGLNNYNVMTAIRNEDAEVGMHSNFIFSLLDVEGEHYQGDLFARLFIKHVLADISNFGCCIKVNVEESCENRRIDFTIKSDKYLIGIEMKTRNKTKDQDRQLIDYYECLKKEAKKGKIEEDNVIIYYLTLDGKEATEKSHKDEVNYVQISFDKHIPLWLDACHAEVANITNLSNAIGYYKDVVKKITNKYDSPITSFKSLFLKDEDLYKFFDGKGILEEFTQEQSNIENGFINAKQELHNNFYKIIMSELSFDNLKFKRFIENSENGRKNDGDILLFEFLKNYDLRLYFKNNCFVNISIGVNNDTHLSDNEKDKYKIKLKDRLSEYITGEKKGEKLEVSIQMPEAKVENLFTYYNIKKISDENIIKLDDKVIVDIQKHIRKIQKQIEAYL